MIFRNAITLLLIMLSSVSYGQNDAMQTIQDRISSDLQLGVNDGVLAKKVTNDILQLKADGSWNDINYADVQYDPLKRIKDMATAYIRPTNKLQGNVMIYNAIVKSLENWVAINPKNKNWWYNDIFYPQAIGQILVLMRNANTGLPAGLEQALIKRMIRKLKVGDYANTSDEALHYLYRACLTKNKATLDSAVEYLYEPIAVIDGKEGIQVDGSYFQHGQQQAIASYGKVFASNSINAAYYLRDTEYALPKDQMIILVGFLKNTFLKTIRGSFYDFNVRGRGISRKDSLMGTVSGMVDKIKFFDPENTNYWKSSSLRTSNKKPADFDVSASHTQFWKSSYTLHVRPTYTFSVQASSSRTLRTERGNNENILGKFLPDGATNIQRSGSEYANLMPIWEWDKIPGTTSRDYEDDKGATIEKDWGIAGTTKFVGGVSDGLYGLSCYDLNYDEVQAKKAWFFFDEEIVCLGAGIKSNAKENITTTINQSWLRSKVLSSTNKKEKWVLQDSIAYIFPENQSLKVSKDLQKGSWSRINIAQGKAEIKNEVFKLWLDHGSNPKGVSYQYIVVPGSSVNSLKKYNSSLVEILTNTAKLQAVKHKGLNMLQAVFYEAGTLTFDEKTLTVDKPCAIYIKDLNTKNPTGFIADPAQENTMIQVQLKSVELGTINLKNNLPTGALAGATKSFKIED